LVIKRNLLSSRIFWTKGLDKYFERVKTFRGGQGKIFVTYDLDLLEKILLLVVIPKIDQG
jgi:hypothetical protein